jgi:hypothetical protein
VQPLHLNLERVDLALLFRVATPQLLNLASHRFELGAIVGKATAGQRRRACDHHRDGDDPAKTFPHRDPPSAWCCGKSSRESETTGAAHANAWQRPLGTASTKTSAGEDQEARGGARGAARLRTNDAVAETTSVTKVAGAATGRGTANAGGSNDARASLCTRQSGQLDGECWCRSEPSSLVVAAVSAVGQSTVQRSAAIAAADVPRPCHTWTCGKTDWARSAKTAANVTACFRAVC